jgi:hypothetical protein
MKQRQQHAFGEKLPQQAAASRTHGGAHGHFALPLGAARHQKVGDIGASDQQHARGGAEQRDQHHARIAHHLFPHGHDLRADVPVRIRMLPLQALHDDAHLGLRLRQRDAGLQSRHTLQEVRAAPGEVFGRERGGGPHLRGSGRKNEAARHHCRHGERLIVDEDLAADDVARPGVPPLPKPIADHGQRRLGLVVLLGEDASQHRHGAHHVPEIRGDAPPDHLFRRSIAREAEGRAARGRDVGEHGVLFPPVHPVRRRGSIAGEADLGRVFPHHHQPVGLWIRQRREQDGIHHAEDCRIRADAQSKRKDCRQRKPGRPAQEPRAVDQIVGKRSHRDDTREEGKGYE